MSHVTLAGVLHLWRSDGARVLTLAAALALLAACGAGNSPEDVADSYGEYRVAVADKDGEASAERVSAATLDHDDRLRDLALTADRAALAKERVVDQLGVLHLATGGGAGTTSVLITFSRQDDVWKIDLTSLLEPAETALAQAAKNQDLEPQAMLEQVMTARVGEDRAQALWRPLGG